MEYFRIFPRPSPNELGEREEGWQLAMRERPQPGTGIGEVGNREGEWQLAVREQPQLVRDHGQGPAISGSWNRDGGLRSGKSDRNWPSQGRGTGMAVGNDVLVYSVYKG